MKGLGVHLRRGWVLNFMSAEMKSVHVPSSSLLHQEISNEPEREDLQGQLLLRRS